MADSDDINDRLEWTVVFLLEFDKKYDLSMKQASEHVHTQSFMMMECNYESSAG